MTERSIWIDAGQKPQARLHDKGITDVYFDARDPQLTPAFFDEIRKSFNPGVFVCSQGSDQFGAWPDGRTMTGRAWADWAYNRIQNELNAPRYVKVCLNCEQPGTAAWIVQALRRWRAHSPMRATVWAPEGRKAGLFSEADVQAINLLSIEVAPQFYTGNMTPHPEGSVTLPMLQKGFQRLSGFFDAANLPYDWKGHAFIQSRLPA